ncbi:aminotransferase class V-fold PLP-dependent enzyme [Candidatus Uabimicrobium amorphum]|uniref:Decarboxylase n=1 Tax=Uabimicrobium amorphum TaxID=2596890 RepID=A0A5S9ILD4_UABAM|nr:aminotransferase class V-fold PLP-dependent enzyme [Candidatus Uabimicrobium amorphum]BBM82705.1 decarboxylase [Candidatus Uabimicrobium amorphum]
MENTIKKLFSSTFTYDIPKDQVTRKSIVDINGGEIEDISENAMGFSEYWQKLQQDIVPRTVEVTNPKFIGHMTSSLPSFFGEISKLITSLNQNVVKTETSHILTFIERKCLEYIHRCVYGDTEYPLAARCGNHMLGTITSNGSLSNTMAMWIARNRALDSEHFSCAEDGMSACLLEKKYRKAVIICSSLAHYSVKKIASLIGIGTNNIISIDVDSNGRMPTDILKKQILQCKKNNICIISIWGIAGTTELGSIDPIDEMAEIAQQHNVHFHVDAAWGGVLALTKYKMLLRGVEKADTVTICGHKQFYLPQGISMMLAKKTQYMNFIETQAKYQARSNSFDLGRWTLEGSRPANSLFLHAALNCIGPKGYESLLQHSFSLCDYFVDKIESTPEFELILPPQMNIVTYRYIPTTLRNKEFYNDAQQQFINSINSSLQKKQWEQGSSFISKTTVNLPQYNFGDTVILRAAIINPLTTTSHLKSILAEQRKIALSLENEILQPSTPQAYSPKALI